MSVTEKNGCIGVVRGTGDSEKFLAKGNFSLSIVAKVEGARDGYLARVTRAPDNVTRYSVCIHFYFYLYLMVLFDPAYACCI